MRDGWRFRLRAVLVTAILVVAAMPWVLTGVHAAEHGAKPAPGHGATQAGSSESGAHGNVAPALTPPSPGGGGGKPEELPEVSNPRSPLVKDPAAARQRLVYRFNFEEREQGNYEDLPMHWHAIGRKPKTDDPTFRRVPLHDELVRQSGFPTFTQVRFDKEQATSGAYALYLGLDGGNVGAFLQAGTIPAIPSSDYRITVNVRTTALKYARARLVAYFIDAQGRRIDASVATTPVVQTDGQWQNIAAMLPGDFTKAAWIGLQVELIQPQAKAQDTLGTREILYQDIKGGAWFDDLCVWQVPRVSLHTQSPVNVIRWPQKPEVRAVVRDMAAKSLAADLVVYDEKGNVVARQRQEIGDGAPMTLTLTPKLPRFGWYVVDLTLWDHSRRTVARPLAVARTRSTFVWLPDDRPPALAGARFVIDASGSTATDLALLPTMMRELRLGSVILSCWDQDTTRAGIEARQVQLDRVIEPMVRQGMQVTLNLSPIPHELRGQIEGQTSGPIGLLTGSGQVWRPYLAPIVMRYGQAVQRWQLGAADRSEAFRTADLPSVLTIALREFRELAPQPRLVVPWNIEQVRRKEAGDGPVFAVSVPTSVHPRDIAAHTTEWSDPPPTDYVLHLRTPDARAYDADDRITDLALRLVYALESGASAVAMEKPWSVTNDGRQELLPDALLGVYAGVAPRLAGRKVLGRLNLGAGLECLIFDGADGGLLAAWNESAPETEATSDLFLGPKPVAIDVWGNRTEVPLVGDKHRLALTRTPQFIEGIDAALALMRSSFQLGPTFLESAQRPSDCTVTLANPWRRTISGTMLVTQPKEWQIEPKRTAFDIPAGQAIRVPLQVRLPVSELAGRKTLVAKLDFNADQHYQVEMSAPVEVGLKGVRFDASLGMDRNRQTGQDDAVVSQTISNTGKSPITLYTYAILPGFPRQERIIPRLEPGQSTVRRFRFPGGAATLKDNDVRVGLREATGPAMLNRVLTMRTQAE